MKKKSEIEKIKILKKLIKEINENSNIADFSKEKLGLPKKNSLEVTALYYKLLEKIEHYENKKKNEFKKVQNKKKTKSELKNKVIKKRIPKSKIINSKDKKQLILLKEKIEELKNMKINSQSNYLNLPTLESLEIGENTSIKVGVLYFDYIKEIERYNQKLRDRLHEETKHQEIKKNLYIVKITTKHIEKVNRRYFYYHSLKEAKKKTKELELFGYESEILIGYSDKNEEIHNIAARSPKFIHGKY